MVAALKLRRERGVGPFTGQCRDNLLGNGRILRQTVVSLARLSDPDLADWIDANCSFPNVMVDCIVPATGPKELALVSAAWARYCLGEREDGSVVELNDPFWDQLTERAKAARENPRIWLEMRNNYGDLADQF